MTDWNRMSKHRLSSGSSGDDHMMMGSPLPRSNGTFSFLTSPFTQGVRESEFNPSDFVSPSKEGEVSMEFSPFNMKNTMQRTECVTITRSQSTPTVDFHEKPRVIPLNQDETLSQKEHSQNEYSPLKENISSNKDLFTRSQSDETFVPEQVKTEQISSLDKLLGDASEKTRSQLFGNISSRSKLFSCPDSDNCTLQPGDIFASSPGSPCSPDTPVLNLFSGDLDEVDVEKLTERSSVGNRNSDQRLRRCHSLEIRKNLFDLSNTPPNAFNRSTSRRSLFKRPLDIQVKEKNLSKRLRDGTLVKYDEKDPDDIKSLLTPPDSSNEKDDILNCDDRTPTRKDGNFENFDEDKTPLSRSNGRVSPVIDKNATALSLKSRRISEKDQERIKTAVDSLQSGELVADGSRVYCLPLVSGKHQDLKNIHHKTMADLIKGKYKGAFDKLTVVDCRYPYEYKGGHIRGAINIYTEKEMSDFLQLEIEKPVERRGVHIIVFHCEFSSQRGPTLLRHLRSSDRQINMMDYPRLVFPEIYCLFGGYKEFYLNHPELCDPSAYTTMNDENQCKAYLHFKQRAKTWSADNRR